MKKKYQIPESESKFLRTSLICGSITGEGGNTPSGDVHEVDPTKPEPIEGDARRRNVNLLEY